MQENEYAAHLRTQWAELELRFGRRAGVSNVSSLHRAAELVALVSVGGCSLVAAFWLVGVADAPGDLLLALALAPVALALADLISGIVHWLADQVLPSDWLLLGPAFVQAFHDHHSDPLGITRHDFVDTNGNNCIASSPFAIWACAAASEAEGATALLAALLLETTLALALTNQIHRWAHVAVPPRAVRALQRVGLVLSRRHHMRHHAPPRDRYFCITNGWMDRVLDGVLFVARNRVGARLHGMLPLARQSPGAREVSRAH
jgi:ubiquitin-conjugating enzyme E2 variant